MPGSDFAVLRDFWPLGRQARFRLRSNRILPGPLKPLHPRKRLPVWGIGLGVVGVSIAAALAIVPQIRAIPHPTDPSPDAAASRESAPSIRRVGSAPEIREAPAVAVEPASSPPAAVFRSSTVEVPPPSLPSPPILSVPEPAPGQTAATPAGFEPLPVLTIDETVFGVPQAEPAELAPRPVTTLLGNR